MWATWNSEVRPVQDLVPLLSFFFCSPESRRHSSPVSRLVSLFQGSSKHDVYSTHSSGRHLLDFNSEGESEAMMDAEPVDR